MIGTRIGGIPEVVEHGKTGYLFPVGEIGRMAEAAIELLRHPDQLAAFRRNARQRAVQHFSIDVIMPQWMAFYEEVLGA